MNFQKVAMIVMILFLVAILTTMGVVLSKAKHNYVYAPDTGDCPDFFEVTDTNKKLSCNNKKNLGNCKSKSKFDSGDFGNTLLEKKTWANKCGIVWDGITNINFDKE
jgi:hypothetical protein